MSCLKNRMMTATVAVLFLTLVGESLANGFRNPPESAAGLGLDGGKLVFTEDAAAVSVNPANLADQDQASTLLGVTLIDAKTDYNSPAGSASTDDPWKVLPNAFAAAPVGEQGVVLGVGITTPFGQSTVWEKDSIFRYTAPFEAELSVINLNPSVGYRASDTVSVGAGLDVYYSELSFQQFVPWSATVPGSPDGVMKFDGDGSGVGWNVGIRLDLTERQHVAATYRSAVSVDYDGDFTVSGTPAPVAATGLGRPSDLSSEVEFPSSAVFGYGIEVTESVRVGLDAEWVEFSTYDQLPVDIGANSALMPTTSIPQNWDDIWSFGVGADCQVSEQCVVRGGYKFMPSPVPSETLSPTLPDSDKHQVSVGVGFRMGDQRVDLAYAYSFYENRTVTDNVNPAYNGTYDLHSRLLAVSYGLNF